MKITLKDLLNIDLEKTVSIITRFIREYVYASNADGVVVGVSGGVDSSVALVLAVKALGPEKVHGLIMPDSETTPKQDIEDAEYILRKFNVKYDIIWINNIYDSYSENLPFFDNNHNLACGNLRARIRMSILYYYANLHNYLVLGASDRSEILIGYFTKYGDGAVDLLPLGCLYKTQVRYLATHLDIPRHIAYKPSSPRLWPDHMAEEELGLKYEEIDLILYGLFDKNMTPEEVAKATGIDIAKVYQVIRMHRKTRHKRSLPPIPQLPNVGKPVKEI